MKLKEKSFKDFFQVPFSIYPKDSNYISPLKSDIKRFLSEKNPLFAKYGRYTYFTLHDDGGKAIGRITAHIHDKSNEVYGIKRGYFGFFDCVNDQGAAKILLDEASRWLKERGCDEIMGNFNLTAMQQCGVMVEGFDNVPFVDQLYTPEHIYKLLEANGFERTFPMRTWEVPLDEVSPDKMQTEKTRKLFEDEDYTFGEISKSTFKKQMEFACDVLNSGFKQNPMFVELTFEEFYFQAKDMTMIIDEKITTFVYHKGRPVGTVIVIPDINPFIKKIDSKIGLTSLYHLWKFKKVNKRALLVFASISPDQQNTGLGWAMAINMMKNLKENGYKKLGITWVADINIPSLTLTKRLGGRPYHRTYLYKKGL